MNKTTKKQERATLSVLKDTHARASRLQRVLAVQLDEFMTVNDVVTRAFDCLEAQVQTARELRGDFNAGPQHVFDKQDEERLAKLERFNRKNE